MRPGRSSPSHWAVLRLRKTHDFSPFATGSATTRLLRPPISDLVKRKSRQEVWEVMSSLGLASGPVLTVGESVEDKHLKARNAFIEVDHPEAGRVQVLAPWVRFSDTPSAITSPAPLMGQHSR